MNEKIVSALLTSLILFSFFALGVLGGEVYELISYDRQFDGFHFKNYNKTEVKQYTQKMDSKGEWISVNIKGMSPKRAFEVCQHEVGHEIFAEYCEQSPENFERCMEVFKNE